METWKTTHSKVGGELLAKIKSSDAPNRKSANILATHAAMGGRKSATFEHFVLPWVVASQLTFGQLLLILVLASLLTFEQLVLP